jgi:hypothetical protein
MESQEGAQPDQLRCEGRKINANGGSIAFVDDYTAWGVGPTAEANRAGIQAIIDRALDWERRSGARFEGEKTAIVHFTRNKERSPDTPFIVKGEMVQPKESAKILCVYEKRPGVIGLKVHRHCS